MHSDRAKQQHRCGRHFYCRGLANVLPINVSFFVTNVVPLTTTRYLHTHTHTSYELIKNSRPIRSRFTSHHPMEPLSPTIDGRRSFDRLYTSPPLLLHPARDQVYCGLVRSRERNSDLPVAPRLALKELRVLPTSRVPSCFYGILPQLQRCSIKGICTFPISPVNICRISCESLANYRLSAYCHLLPIFSNDLLPTSF